ncbi:MAG: glutamine--fructose-6-phosphate transaminase (isomerizing) [Firmicutes bacterium]|nr:glutamine--fructose-6-phosphate transaminase (isomerizing) [Bacillota bacterium]MCL2256293.1 glutamine--fructose-6-phosphate transaminase (isomerizing) [Bacillota bacterium]
MCGIVGYIGSKRAADIVIDGLKKLEYRGYDSAGVGLIENGKLEIIKKKGRVVNTEESIPKTFNGGVAIGHTRWATHGVPSDNNSHPHRSESIAVVHNGIIENYAVLKKELEEEGILFQSETDTEVIPHLIKSAISHSMSDIHKKKREACYLHAVLMAIKKLKGSYALAILNSDFPDTIVCVKKGSPLVVSKSESSVFVASDVEVASSHGKNVYILEDDEMVLLRSDEVSFFDMNGREKEKDPMEYISNESADGFAGNPHYMLKEIKEIPQAIHETAKSVENCFLKLPKWKLNKLKKIIIVGCGTAYHAGLSAKTILETHTGIPVANEIASEFRYSNPIIDKNTLVILVSQSGETADTIAALDIAKKKKALTLAVVNNATSALAMEADCKITTRAGKEIAVASTKAYNSQLVALYSFALYLSVVLRKINSQKARELKSKIMETTSISRQVIEMGLDKIDKTIIDIFKNEKAVMFLGRGVDYATAAEASLKLKEISYIHCESYPAGELKHGTIALIEEGYLVVAYLTDSLLKDKTLNALYEVKARGAKVFAITNQELPKDAYDYIYHVPSIGIFSPITSIIPMQIISYFTAIAKDYDPDKPRNLAKSVTVE